MTKEKTCVVVYDNSKFGSEICYALALSGYKLFVLTNKKTGVNELKEKLERISDTHKIIEMEMMDSREVSTVIQSIIKSEQEIVALVYLLPAQANSSIRNMDEKTWGSLDLELSRMFWCYRAISKQMAKQRHGSILGITFGVNARGDSDMLTWTMAGEAMVGMSKCLAAELLKQDVRVNTVCYGYMDGVPFPELAHTIMQEYGSYLGINRKGNAKDVESLLSLLISNEGSYITGQTLYVNGGLLI